MYIMYVQHAIVFNTILYNGKVVKVFRLDSCSVQGKVENIQVRKNKKEIDRYIDRQIDREKHLCHPYS